MSCIISTATIEALINEHPELTFTEFPNLPPELRRLCWKFALPGPRIITVTRCISQFVKNDWQDSEYGHQPLAASNAIAPAMLFVNIESRKFAFRSYKLMFKHHLLKPIYFDFGHDTFFFPSSSLDLESFLVLDDGEVTSEDHARVERVNWRPSI
ncbi:uncharacterized protein RCO7_08799 [Rhynchosporium graminicola]|uniref:2EXR domain-containing protein n=1 Tax=Rhynchosporium graminicola TaxID=2792576 RepID=A0A1E1KCR1_9HELO|nr:uncharacterized protein RCO7_08799 [Rhynchosporium commune]